MTIAAPSPPISSTKMTEAIFLTLLPQAVGVFGLFPLYAFGQGSVDLRILSIALALFTLLTFAGLWLRAHYALWAVLVVVSFQATIDLWAVARGIHGALALTSLALLAVTTVLAFWEGKPLGSDVTPYQRVLFAFVFLFAAWVAVWGLFLPTKMAVAIPLAPPPLHARFLGAMYLSGAVFMFCGLIASKWDEVRVVTLMLALWTGLLGLVSALHLDAFDWSLRTTWFWFVAYIGYPLIALWIAWIQRLEPVSEAGPASTGLLKTYLHIQGAVAIALGSALMIAPTFMTTMWPWSVSALLAQIYSAPFLSFGIGALYAGRQRTWRAIRNVVLGSFVSPAAVVAASSLYLSLFSFQSPSAWLWFAGFTIAGIFLLLFMVLPSSRSARPA